MPTTRKIKTLMPDRKWRNLLNQRGFTRKYGFENTTLEPLKHLLLDIGGSPYRNRPAAPYQARAEVSGQVYFYPRPAFSVPLQ